MLCFVGLVVLAFMALFSARHRPLAREAVDCVFRRVTLRTCTTGLDHRLKAMITGRLVVSHPGAARFLHRHLETLAWLFVLLGVASSATVGYGLYNSYRYGHCAGPADTGFCVFDPSGTKRRPSGLGADQHGENLKPGDGAGPALGSADARVTIVEFGSYTCPSTRASEPVVRDLVQRHASEVRLVFRHFPLDGLDTLRAGVTTSCEVPATAPGDHAGATRAAIAADCAGAQGRFWEYHQRLAASPGPIATCTSLIELAGGLGLNEAEFARCLGDSAVREHVRRDFEEGVKAGISGTPTFFIGGSRLVAPSPEELREAVDRAIRRRRS